MYSYLNKSKPARLISFYLYTYIVLILFVNNFEGPKQQILWVGGPLLALLFGGYYLSRPYAISREVKMYFLFTLYTLIAFFFVADVELMFDYWTLIVSILVFIFCISLSYHLSATLLNLLTFLWLACAMVCLYSIYAGDLSGFFSGEVQFRPEGGFIRNPNGLANFARIGILSAIVILAIPGKNKLLKPILLLYIPLATILIVMTASRGAFVNIILVYGLVGWVIIKNRTGSYGRILFVFLLLGILSYIVYDQYFATSFLSERLTRIEATTSNEGVDTNEMRFQLFITAIDLFKESVSNAFFGIGLNQFRLYSGGLISHSEYSDIFVTTGLIGAYLYYSIYIILWRKLSKLQIMAKSETRRLFQICQVMIFSELMYGFVNPNFLTIIEMVFIFMLVGFASFELKKIEVDSLSHQKVAVGQ